MAGVWVFAEDRELTLEILNAGRMLADRLQTKLGVFYGGERELADEYFTHGADEAYFMPPLPLEQPLESYVPVIAEKARADNPEVLLVGGTRRGKEMAARIAARLDAGMVSDSISFKFDDENRLEIERVMYGGRAIQTVTCLTRPQVATVAPRVFKPSSPAAGRTGEVVELPAPPPSSIKVLERKPKDVETASLQDAKVVVCVGRGIEKQEELELARELAAVLGGEIGCTRPIAEEYHWLPENLYIGLSGCQVKPNLYIGVGVSGQVQHVIGITDSKLICSVNRDENAPIFSVSDYGIVGDLREVLPRLIEGFKKALKK